MYNEIDTVFKVLVAFLSFSDHNILKLHLFMSRIILLQSLLFIFLIKIKWPLAWPSGCSSCLAITAAPMTCGFESRKGKLIKFSKHYMLFYSIDEIA